MRSLLLLLVACGPHQPEDKQIKYHPTSVTPAYETTFKLLSESVNEMVGYSMLAVDPKNGLGAIVIDEARLDRLPTANGLTATGAYSKATHDVVMRMPVGPMPITPPDGSCIKLHTCRMETMFFAHEIGHALGAEHIFTDSGLMRPQGDIACDGREAQCLVDALTEQGLLQ